MTNGWSEARKLLEVEARNQERLVYLALEEEGLIEAINEKRRKRVLQEAHM